MIMTKAGFYNILDDIIEEDPGTISGDELLADLEGWDSLSVVAFIAAMDKHLGVAVTPKKLVEAASVADLMDLVAGQITD